MEDLDGAIADYNRAIELDPLVANTYLNRSSAKQMKNDLEGAIKDCDAAIKIRPHFSGAYLMRGIAKFEKQDYAGSLKDYDICIRLDPKMAQAFVNRGIVKHKLEDTQGAIPDYDMAIKLNPDIAVAWLNRGIAKETLKIPGFESDFAVAEQLDPKFAQFRKRLDAEQEREKQRRLYGFVLPTPNQNQTGQNNPANQAANTPANQAANTPANQQATQGQQATTGGATSSPIPAQIKQPDIATTDSASVAREDGKGPVTRKRSRRNIIVNEGGEVTETEVTRGMVQNRNVNIELQPEFIISIFHKDSVDYERLQYYSMEIDAVNRKNSNQPFMLITNKPIGSEEWRAGEYKENIHFLDQQLQTNRKNSDSYFNRAIFYELLKNYDQAIEDYNRAIKADGRNILAYFSRANTLMKRVDFIRMPGLLPEPTTLNISGTKAAADAPKEEQILDYEDIIKDYESILYMNPRFIFAWFNMGNTKVKKRDYLGAINDFNRGLTRIFLNDMEGGSLDLSKAGELGLTEAYNVIKRYCN
jgi:tetratricopeptide (TPR) repeat protein